jgi:hypothetical protein
MHKILALLIALTALTACGKPSLGDREAALEYLKTNKPGEVGKPLMHSVSYFANWCAEGDEKYWPQAVKFCEPSKSTISGNLCSFVNIVEKARIEGKSSCDPT